MAISKVEYNGTTLIDLTEDTVTPDTLIEGVTAHAANGEEVVGTFDPTKYLEKTGDAADTTVTFSEASERENINTGEQASTLFGKIKKWFSDLKTVAFTGSYDDLSNRPSIPSVGNGTITINQGGATKGSFSMNQSGDATVNLTDSNTWRPVQNNLTSDSTTDCLAAAQGKILKGQIDELNNNLSAIDQIYVGQDLTVKFADEIKGYSDEWAWAKARKNAGNYAGIHVGDYIPITCSNGYVLKAQIAGINTYTGYADQQVGNHIDFICKELWNNLHAMNKVNYNNGNANSPSPFLASDLNYWLNSMSGTVPNSTSDPSVTTEVDYTAGGVLYYLPDKLKNQIITKRILLPSRYTAGQVLTNDNSWAWQSTGKLWIPSEVEVYGAPCWGNSGYGMGGFVQYPLFACNMNRAKLRCASKDRYTWWLLSANAGNSTYFAYVYSHGICDGSLATYTWVAAPVCFRI